MKILFLGGTGNISIACTKEGLRQGFEIVHYHRGQTKRPDSDALTSEIQTIQGDIRNREEAKQKLKDLKFDCVVDWVAFTPEQISSDITLFRHITDQFIFISSASVYHKPPRHYLITESTPAYNPFWQYSQNKIVCERLLMQAYEDAGFPATIVRPSHTYNDGWFPTSFGSSDFTVPQRMVDEKEIIVHGDGQSLWTITHADDFALGLVGLFGNPNAIGETFHITSDECLTWDQIHLTIAGVLGVVPSIVHLPSEYIAQESPETGPGLLGDKMYSMVFDNSKIKRFVPGFQATVPFHRGMERSLAWVEKYQTKIVDKKTNELIENLLNSYGRESEK